MKKQPAFALIAAIALSAPIAGCVAPTAGGAVALMPPGAVVNIPDAHVHSLQCPHFWGYYGGRPVYYVDGKYISWVNGSWESVPEPDEHGTHHHYIEHEHVVVNDSLPPGFLDR